MQQINKLYVITVFNDIYSPDRFYNQYFFNEYEADRFYKRMTDLRFEAVKREEEVK